MNLDIIAVVFAIIIGAVVTLMVADIIFGAEEVTEFIASLIV